MEALSLDSLVAQVRADVSGGDSLDRLEAATRLAGQLGERADAVVDHFVAAARGDGRSWTEIGGRLGVSKQAARKRFMSVEAREPALPDQVSLRPRLQACLDQAVRRAQSVGAPEVGTDHLLAGLMFEGVAASILDRLGVTADAVAASAQRLFGGPGPAGEDPPPLSAEAVCAIEAAADRAQAGASGPGDVMVGTEHVLLVLAFDPGSRARRVLTDLGVNLAAVKKQLACYVTGVRRGGRRLGRRRRPSAPACSFCGTAESTARPLVHGPGVNICSVCMQRAGRSLAARGNVIAGFE